MLKKSLGVLAGSILLASSGANAFQSAEHFEGSTMVVVFNGPGGYQVYDTGVLANDFVSGDTSGFELNISSAFANLGEIDSYSIFGILGGNTNTSTYIDHSTGVVFAGGDQSIYPTHFVSADDPQLTRFKPNSEGLVPQVLNPLNRSRDNFSNLTLAYLEGLRTGERILFRQSDGWVRNLVDGSLINENGQYSFHVDLAEPGTFCCDNEDFLFDAFLPYNVFNAEMGESFHSVLYEDFDDFLINEEDINPIAINYSISFEEGVFSVTTIPLPGAAWLFLSGLGDLPP